MSPKDRESFGSDELAICLSHYDLGVVRSITEFARGSHHAPKAIIDAETGKYLLKRRARGKASPKKVDFTHKIQSQLVEHGFPLPRLIGTKHSGNLLLAANENIYEMFEYIEGDDYDGSLEATYDAGRILGLYHKLLQDFESDYSPPGSYHDQPTIHTAIKNTVSSLPAEGRPPGAEVTQTISSLETAYRHAANEATNIGLSTWPLQIVHGDWHPGNMLFQDKTVVAVVDYDAARLQQRVIDLANGALQFSILGGSRDPSQWPAYLDEARFKDFMRGYDSVTVISKSELQAVPFLMIEAMIAEAVLPIAATGSFGRIEGFPFLQMIDRKVHWILANLTQLQSILG